MYPRPTRAQKFQFLAVILRLRPVADGDAAKLRNQTRQSKAASRQSYDRWRLVFLILLQSPAIPSIYHPYRCIWGLAMAGEIHRPRDKPGETEKITINVGYVDLGHIDLLVHEGFYSNRTDFIRTAIRNQLATHADAVKQSIVRHTLELGLRRYSREDLEAVREAGGKLRIQVVGLAAIAEDVTPELALATIESITVLGALQASKAVKAALSDRIG